MKLSYTKTVFSLKFESPVRWSTIPTFFIRSILGVYLKKICCIQRQSVCDNCILVQSCAYSVLFESPLPQDNSILQGRNRAYHPFILTHGAVSDNGLGYDFVLTLIGKGIEYFPFVIYALQQAGKEGIFASKVHFEVSQVLDEINQNSLLGKALRRPVVQQFDLSPQESPIVNSVIVFFRTPARIKYMGKYTTMFDACSFFGNLYRRTVSLALLYENQENGINDHTIHKFHIPTDICITDRKLLWKDFKRYSHRQQTEMELGGVIGSLVLQGTVGWQEQKLLEGGRLFHIGKNTVFGLGEMSYQILN